MTRSIWSARQATTTRRRATASATLVDRLEAAFSCTCQADRHIEDASHHGRVEIPAAAAATRSQLVIVVSNFGGLAVVAIDNPGVWTGEELTELLHPDDAGRIYPALV
jgi:hypothetical protein